MLNESVNWTRARILVISAGLFRRQGYAGTSIADIAEQLRLSKSALYYHFKSKDEILDAIIAEPIAIYKDIASSAGQGSEPAELLGKLIDLVAAPESYWAMLEGDPSVLYAIGEQATQHKLLDKTRQIIESLCGPDTSRDARIRATAAFAIAKEATRILTYEGKTLSSADRAAVLESALVALGPQTRAGNAPGQENPGPR